MRVLTLQEAQLAPLCHQYGVSVRVQLPVALQRLHLFCHCLLLAPLGLLCSLLSSVLLSCARPPTLPRRTLKPISCSSPRASKCLLRSPFLRLLHSIFFSQSRSDYHTDPAKYPWSPGSFHVTKVERVFF